MKRYNGPSLLVGAALTLSLGLTILGRVQAAPPAATLPIPSGWCTAPCMGGSAWVGGEVRCTVSVTSAGGGKFTVKVYDCIQACVHGANGVDYAAHNVENWSVTMAPGVVTHEIHGPCHTQSGNDGTCCVDLDVTIDSSGSVAGMSCSYPWIVC